MSMPFEAPLGLSAAGLGGAGFVDVEDVTLLEGYRVQLGWVDGDRTASGGQPRSTPSRRARRVEWKTRSISALTDPHGGDLRVADPVL